MKSIQQETENNETEKQNKNKKEKEKEKSQRRVESRKGKAARSLRLDTNRFPPQIPNIPGSRLSVARKRAQQREKRRS